MVPYISATMFILLVSREWYINVPLLWGSHQLLTVMCLENKPMFWHYDNMRCSDRDYLGYALSCLEYSMETREVFRDLSSCDWHINWDLYNVFDRRPDVTCVSGSLDFNVWRRIHWREEGVQNLVENYLLWLKRCHWVGIVPGSSLEVWVMFSKCLCIQHC